MIQILIILLLILILAEGVVRSLGENCKFENPDLIVFLGSGNRVDLPLLNDRILKLIQAAEEFPTAQILISGNDNKNEVSSVLTEIDKLLSSEANSKNNIKKNIKNRILIHTTALRTFDSFQYIKTDFKTVKTIFIVTNAFHMRRSMALAALFAFSSRGYMEDINYSLSPLLFFRERVANVLFLGDVLGVKYKKYSSN